MRWTAIILALIALLVAGVLLLGSVRPADPTDGAGDEMADDPHRSPPDGALAKIREELTRAEPVHQRTDADRLADARAWVAANRPPDWPYGELEAWMLAQVDATADHEERSAAWVLQNARVELETTKALDADADGVVTDEEVRAFAAFHANADMDRHPYIVARFDVNGDGVLQPDEAPWHNRDAYRARASGLVERARADLWDRDDDGRLSDDERAAGQERALLSAQIFEDGHIEYVPEPGEQAAAEQSEVRQRMLEVFGQEALDLTLERQSQAAEMHLSIGLEEAMRLVEGRPDYASGGPAPLQPESADFDADGDGRLIDAELEALMAAMTAWEHELRMHGSLQFAEFHRSLFDAALGESDLNGDGKLAADEWDARLGLLSEARDARLLNHHYDLDQSGRVEPAELDTFLGWYRAGSLRADANYDGRIDGLDLRHMADAYERQGR